MFLLPVTKRSVELLSLCLIVAVTVTSYATPPPSGNNVSQTVTSPVMPSRFLPKKNSYNSNPAIPTQKETHDTSSGTSYTIKAGDNLFKILMREYGLTNLQAEKFIEIVRRENNISNFRRLRIGQKISISALRRKNVNGPLTGARKTGRPHVPISKTAAQTPPPLQVFTLEKPVVPVLQASDMTAHVKQVWEKIVPGHHALKKTLSVNSDNVSITLDPVKYPILTAMDGGRILVDVDGKISPTIKSIISRTDPGLRVVAESAADPKRFLASLVNAGTFYSVAEDFVMEFGSDPRLTIRSDFRVERTAESLVNQDVVLLNSGKIALSSKLTEFLKKEGFTLYEPFALAKPHIFSPRNRLIQVTAGAPLDIASSILKALSITAEVNARIEVADIDNSGISISITPDRYFQYKGKAYCIRYVRDTSFDTSLAPILAARGIHSIDLDRNDDFHKISERILTSVGLSGTYGFHKLWPEEDTRYSLQMSGVMIDGAGVAGESLFLTNREIDRIIKDISVENGYIVQN